MRTKVISTLRVAGFHCWPAAPSGVSYLKERHRHLFTVRVEFVVSHDDRDVEFHTALTWVREALNRVWQHEPYEFGFMSCEQIAKAIATRVTQDHDRSPFAVEVWEDDECGARVEFRVSESAR